MRKVPSKVALEGGRPPRPARAGRGKIAWQEKGQGPKDGQ